MIRQLFFFLPLIISFTGYSQQIKYFDSNLNEVLDTSHYYFKELMLQNDSTALYEVTRKDSMGALQHKKSYLDEELHILQGTCLKWHSNGVLKSTIEYMENMPSGNLLTYWDNGQLKRSEKFKAGVSEGGQCYNSKGEAIDFFDYEEMPQFPGGDDALFQFLGREMRYPKMARRAGIEGVVVIRFIISEKGDLESLEVVRSVHKTLDNEALRVVKLMPSWNPAKQDGENVRVYFNLPIKFQLT